ncbi:MAG TPA: sigma-70 family RNA polymerase sigma factor [Kofleriaceae bacterium]|nr:sigma-70 family RNA polymerase sigma factor [Kofleriaceae bacterium]
MLQAFRDALPDEARPLVDDSVGTALGEMIAAARAAHPAIATDDVALAKFVGVRLGDAKDLAAALRAFPAGDLLLACGCAAGDREAQEAFDHILDEVDAAAIAVRAPADTVDEVKQMLRTQLLVAREDRPPAIAGYAGRGSLRAWLRITATRELVRQIKKQLRDVPLEQAILDQPGEGDPVLERLKAQYRAEFAAALGEALIDLDPRERTLLRLSVLDQLGIDEIGAIYAVHRATAARWLVKARSSLVEQTQKRLAGRLNLDEGEITSVIRMIQSKLDVSVERLIDEAERKS